MVSCCLMFSTLGYSWVPFAKSARLKSQSTRLPVYIKGNIQARLAPTTCNSHSQRPSAHSLLTSSSIHEDARLASLPQRVHSPFLPRQVSPDTRGVFNSSSLTQAIPHSYRRKDRISSEPVILTARNSSGRASSWLRAPWLQRPKTSGMASICGGRAKRRLECLGIEIEELEPEGFKGFIPFAGRPVLYCRPLTCPRSPVKLKGKG